MESFAVDESAVVTCSANAQRQMRVQPAICCPFRVPSQLLTPRLAPADFLLSSARIHGTTLLKVDDEACCLPTPILAR